MRRRCVNAAKRPHSSVLVDDILTGCPGTAPLPLVSAVVLSGCAHTYPYVPSPFSRPRAHTYPYVPSPFSRPPSVPATEDKPVQIYQLFTKCHSKQRRVLIIRFFSNRSARQPTLSPILTKDARNLVDDQQDLFSSWLKGLV
jgi:hypothetical protein